MAAAPVISGRDMTDPVSVSSQAITFSKAIAVIFFRIVDRNGVPAVLFHDREARDIGGTVADINHVGERDGPDLVGHVVIDVLGHVQEAFVDPEQVLCFLGVTDDSFRETDPALRIFGIFAAEHGPEIKAGSCSLQSGP